MLARFKQLNRIFMLIGVRIAGAALAGVLAVLVARLHGADYSGRFFYLISTITIASVATRLGAEPYLTSRLAAQNSSDPSSNSTYISSTFFAVGLVVALAGGVTAVLDLVAPAVGATVLADVPVPILMIAVLGLNSNWIVTGYARARGKAAVSIFLETGLLSLWMVGLLGIAALASFEPTARVVASSFALMLPVTVCALFPLYARAGWGAVTLRSVHEALKGIVSFGAVTVTNGIIILIPLQVLGWNGMTDDAGIYNAALRVSMFVGAAGVVVKSLVVRSHLHGVTQGSRARDLGRAVIVALPWIGLSFIVAWQGQWLTALFGDEFEELESIILVMLLAQSVNVGGFLLETRAVLADERKMLNIASLTTLVVSLPASLVLIQEFGLPGAAYAFAVTIVVSRGQLAWMYVRADRIDQKPEGGPESTPSGKESS